MNNINKLMINKKTLNDKVEAGLIRELQRQKKAGKKFISDEDIDKLVDEVIKEELGDAWKEHYA